MYKSRFLVALFLLLFSSLLQAQSAAEKEFITIVNTMVKEGGIRSISKVTCGHGNCQVKDLVMVEQDPETGKKSTLSLAQFKVKEVDNFVAFKQRKGAMKEGSKEHFTIEAKDIKSDGHNLFFDKNEMEKEFGAKSEIYNYFKKHLDSATNGSYTLNMAKNKGDVKMNDNGRLSVGAFSFGIESKYTIKGGFEKVDELAAQNPMGLMAIVVVHNIHIHIQNPKGFLRNLSYMNYSSEMRQASSKEQKKIINTNLNLSGEKVYAKEAFVKQMRATAKQQLEAVVKKDPTFNNMLNKNNQLEKKIDAILSGSSKSIDININNAKNLSIGDFFTLVMGYAMQQKLATDPGVVITIK